MNESIRQKCLDYLTGELGAEDRASFEGELAVSSELRQLVQQYREVLGLEAAIAAEKPAIGAHFSVKVMEALEQNPVSRSRFVNGFIERYFAMTRRMVLPLGATCALMFAVYATIAVKREHGLQKFSEVSKAKQAPEALEPPGRERAQTDRSAQVPAKVPATPEADVVPAPKQEWFGADKAATRMEETSGDRALGGSLKNQAPAEMRRKDRNIANPAGRENTVGKSESIEKEVESANAELEAKRDSSANKLAMGQSRAAGTAITEGVAATVEEQRRIGSATDGAGGIMRPIDREAAAEQKSNQNPAEKPSAAAVGERYADDSDAGILVDEDQALLPLPSVDSGRQASAPASAGRPQAANVYRKRNVMPSGSKPAELARRPVTGAYMPPLWPPGQDQSGEEYGIYEENPRTLVAREPRSTFSIDVDTGSYSNLRRFLSMGQLPPPHSVRVEELINYFSYNYPTQAERPFAVHYEIAPSPFSQGRHLLKLGIKSRDAAAEVRKPWNLVFLIDVSGSMAPQNKLPLLKKSFDVLIANLRDGDHLALVTYSGNARVVLPATSGSNREAMRAAINSLSASGATNGSAGIQMAYDEAEKFKQPGSVNRVIVATDGDFNVGTTSFDGLMQLIEAKRASGTTLTVVGLGDANLKEKSMEQMSDRGDGNYFYIDSFAEARKVFEQQLAQNMAVIAKDVKIQIEFNPKQVVEYRLIGYDNRKLANTDFANDAVDAGEIGPGHTVTALYEVVFAGSTPTGDVDESLRYQLPKVEEADTGDELGAELAFVKIRFKGPQGGSSEKMQFPVERAQAKSSFREATEDLRFAAGVAGFGQLLRGSKYAGGYSYDDVAAVVRGAIAADPKGERRQFADLVDNARAVKR